MRYFRKVNSLALLLALLLFLSACGKVSRGVIKESFTDITAGDIDLLGPDALNGSYKVSDEVLNILHTKMELCLSNEYAEVYLGKYYDIAVLDKKTGNVTFSNEALALGQTGVSDEDSSQLIIEFYDSSDTMTTMTSYPECVDNAGKNQVTVSKEEGKLSLLYQFGVKLEDRIISPAFTKETYNMLLEKANDMKKKGELTTMQVGRFKMGYLQLVYKDLSDTDKSIYTAKYPSLPKVGEMYVVKEGISNLQKKEVEELSVKLGVTKELIKEELAKLGELSQNQNVSPYFEINLTYSLDGRDLKVSTDPKKIVEQDTFFLTKMEVLPCFGAADIEKGGYLFLPDGSGTVVDINQNSKSMNTLSLSFYGSDFGVNQKNGTDISAYAPFPVFGIYSGGKSLFAVVESGEAMGGVTGRLPTTDSAKGKANPWFYYRVLDYIDTSGLEVKSAKNIYSVTPEQSPYVIRYHLLYGEDADYSGMARYYRTYLEKNGVIKKKENSSYYVDLSVIGSFNKKVMRFGLQSEVSACATSFENAKTMAESLKKNGVDSLNMIYTGAVNGGLDFSIADKAEFEKVLGGKSGFENLLNAMKSLNFSLYPAFDYTRVYKDGKGLDSGSQLSRYLNNDYSVLAAYTPSEMRRSSSRTAYQVSPTAFMGLTEKLAESYAKYSNRNISIESVASYLNADYNEKDEITREKSKYAAVDSLKSLCGKDLNLKLEGANVYTLKYASSLSDLPVTDSNYKISSYSIPFVAMVLHGYIDYSGPTLTKEGNYKKALLKTIESGATLSYEVFYEDPIIFAETEYNDLYSMSFSSWEKEISESYKKAKAVLGGLGKNTIEKHQRLTDKVNKVSYSDGNAVIVNYGDTAVTVNSVTIAPLDFALIKEG